MNNRKIFSIVALILAIASVAFAQSAPSKGNRQTIIQNLINKYPQVLEGPSSTFDDRRRLLIPVVAIELNKIDGNNWALLYRMDRNDNDPTPGRLTSDVLVWKPTKEHFDVFGGSGKPEDSPSKRLVATYNLIGPLPNDKDWFVREPEEFKSYATQQPVPVPTPQPNPTPVPVPVPVPAPTSEIELLKAEIASLKAGLFQLREEGASVYKSLQNSLNDLANQIGGVQTQAQDHTNRITVIESRKIPSGCKVQFLSCRLE